MKNPETGVEETTHQNYQSMGIIMNPNDRSDYRNSGKPKGKEQIQLEDIETIDPQLIQQMTSRSDPLKVKKPVVVEENEERILRKMILKCGQNLSEMERDRKLNTLLWTTNQIRKKIEALEQMNGAAVDKKEND